MNLYICYSTEGLPWHKCAIAYKALEDSGYHPEIIKSYGSRYLPRAFNQTKGRLEVERACGNNDVPTLFLDDEKVIQGHREIEAWAMGNPVNKSS